MQDRKLEGSRLLALWTATTFAVVVAFLTHLSLRFQTARLGYELAGKRTVHARLMENERLLATERATLEVDQRIRTIAQTALGLHAPMQHQIIPFERTTEFMQDIFGCTLSEGTLKNWTAEAYSNLTQTEEQIKVQLQQADILHSDETGMFCENKLHWIHSASTEIYTHYGIHQKRGKKAMDDIGILPKAKGRIIHDFWESYARYKNVTHAYCNAHIVRELRAVHEQHHQAWAQKLIDLLFLLCL